VFSSICEAYRRTSRRLLLLDYDGTLTPLVRRPDLAAPTPATLELLTALTEDPNNTLVLVSGRDRKTLESWFGSVEIGLVAEHGIWRKERGGEWQTLGLVDADWKARLLPIFEQYADRLPGAMVEEKEHSIVWHYRAADPDQSRLLAAELTDRIVGFAAKIDAQVLQGNKVVEVRPAAVNKGAAARHWLTTGRYDFVFAAGDDWTDEDLFAVLPEEAFSIRIGVTNTLARFNVTDVHEMARLLHSFLESPAAR